MFAGILKIGIGCTFLDAVMRIPFKRPEKDYQTIRSLRLSDLSNNDPKRGNKMMKLLPLPQLSIINHIQTI